jgi:hypothetical protein
VCQRLCKTVLVLAAGGAWLLNTARADSPAAPTDRPYQARWIWCQVESPEPFQFARFRKTIDVASRPKSAAVYITADTFYRLWINGQFPTTSDGDTWDSSGLR